MKNIIRTHCWLILILILASFLRLYNLGSNPPALYWDEASLGYNAFSILKKGIDEHGVRFPVSHFLAYGDAKPPVYIYATSISIAVFGVTEFAIRFPSAMAGILLVLLTYLLAKALEKPLRLEKIGFAELVSLLLAIAPWHLHVSRVAYEANVALTLFVSGFVCFVYAQKRPSLYLLSAIFWVSTWYTFNAYRIFLPLFLLVLGIIFFKQLWQNRGYVLLSIGLALILTAPLVPFVLSDQAKLRFDEVTIFKDLNPVIDANNRIELNDQSLWSKLVYNRRVLFAAEFLDGYFDHFKFDFLFFSGDVNPRLGVRDIGMLYLVELPLILAGIFYLIKTKGVWNWILMSWLLLSIVPAAIARETPHALRTLQVLPLPQLVAAIGFVYLYRNWNKIVYLAVFGYIGLFAQYLSLYHGPYRQHWSNSWQYGYKELVSYLRSVEANYDRIYITQSLGRPHTYILLYSEYDPETYVKIRDAGGDAFGFTQTYSFDKYYFVEPPAEKPEKANWLYVSNHESLVAQEKIRHIVYNLRGEVVFVIHE